MKARDLMTPNPRVVVPTDTLVHAARIMRDNDVGIVPVVDDPNRMHLRGVVTDRDIVVRCFAEGHTGPCTVGEHMSGGRMDTVSPAADVEQVMEVMKDCQVRRVMVTDGDRLVGVIAQADLARREGPIAPARVEAVLERVSEPTHAGTAG